VSGELFQHVFTIFNVNSCFDARGAQEAGGMYGVGAYVQLARGKVAADKRFRIPAANMKGARSSFNLSVEPGRVHFLFFHYCIFAVEILACAFWNQASAACALGLKSRSPRLRVASNQTD
jgi:hypothetical protein